uniref:C3H1-type domain-containing protein n=1 Tax=Zooxanthella nutricula TaxID=1333877 RepID=A0A7S2IFD3_9DINO
MAPQMGAPAWQGPYLDAATGRYYYFDPVSQQSAWAQTPAMGGAMGACGGCGGCGVSAAYSSASLGGGGRDGREECGDWKRGLCDRGDTCKYVHVGPAQERRIGKEECRDFRAGRCTRGEGCRFSHGDAGRARSRSR